MRLRKRFCGHQDDFQGKSSVKTWITRIAINVCKDMLTDPWARHRSGEDLPDEATPEASFSSEDRYVISGKIANLPPKYKEVICLLLTVMIVTICSVVPSIVSALSINDVSRGVQTAYYDTSLHERAYFEIQTSGLNFTMYYRVYFMNSASQPMYANSTQAINGTKNYYSSYKDKIISYYEYNYRIDY